MTSLVKPREPLCKVCSLKGGLATAPERVEMDRDIMRDVYIVHVRCHGEQDWLEFEGEAWRSKAGTTFWVFSDPQDQRDWDAIKTFHAERLILGQLCIKGEVSITDTIGLKPGQIVKAQDNLVKRGLIEATGPNDEWAATPRGRACFLYGELHGNH